MGRIKIKSNISLTIAYPTYNRSKAVTYNLKKLFSHNLPKCIKVLVIDNCSSDKTFEKLSHLKKIHNFNLIKNRKNIGGVENIIKLFLSSKTDYILICSDEDEVLIENINHVLSFLNKRKPKFVSGQIIKKGKISRGSRFIRKLKKFEFGPASYYMSGLIFRLNDAKKIIKDINPFLQKIGCDYPHTMIAANLGFYQESWYIDKPLTKKNFQLRGYYGARKPFSFAGRCSQFMIFDQYYSKMTLKHKSKSSYYKDLLENHRKGIFFWIINGLINEKQDLVKFKYLNPIALSKFFIKRNLNKYFKLK